VKATTKKIKAVATIVKTQEKLSESLIPETLAMSQEGGGIKRNSVSSRDEVRRKGIRVSAEGGKGGGGFEKRKMVWGGTETEVGNGNGLFEGELRIGVEKERRGEGEERDGVAETKDRLRGKGKITINGETEVKDELMSGVSGRKEASGNGKGIEAGSEGGGKGTGVASSDGSTARAIGAKERAETSFISLTRKGAELLLCQESTEVGETNRGTRKRSRTRTVKNGMKSAASKGPLSGVSNENNAAEEGPTLWARSTRGVEAAKTRILGGGKLRTSDIGETVTRLESIVAVGRARRGHRK
jgi:hypothetical protein